MPHIEASDFRERNVKFWVGTSGFSYSHWKGGFYPEDLPQNQWLEFYVRHFNSVEINSSFYHLPLENVLRSWHRRSPPDFAFVLKGSRFVTHRCRLRNCEEPVELFYTRAGLLGNKLSAILWQLPAGLKADAGLLDSFLGLLAGRAPCVIEFREASWYRDDICEILEKYGATLCIHDMPNCRPPDRLTTRTAYLRFHGFGIRYGGTYPDELLRDRASWVRSSGAETVYAYFNNDVGGHAIRDAMRFRAYLCSSE